MHIAQAQFAILRTQICFCLVPGGIGAVLGGNLGGDQDFCRAPPRGDGEEDEVLRRLEKQKQK
jgi:hypothetical protein